MKQAEKSGLLEKSGLMFLRASKSKGQGAVEYLLILAVVLVIALAAITYVSSASSESARTNKMESQVYWGSVATPLKIQDAGAAYGTICQQPEKGGYQFLLRNSEPYDISLSSISIDGVQRVFCVAGSPSGALQISARSQRFVAAITASGELPCKEGDLVYLNLGFGFNKSGVSGLSQEGSKPLVLICANSAPINETSIIGVHTGARANITISAAPSLSSAYVGEAIPSVQVSAQGGTSPYAWSVAGLPSGLSFSNGAIIGAPALGTEGVHNILIQASDYVGNTGELEIQMTVYSLPTITSGRLPNANVGSPYSFEIITAGGQTPYSWYTTGLPSGLSQLGSTISGAPAQGTAGTYSVFMRLTDFSGHSANATLPLHVNLAYPVMITTNSLSYAYEQQDYFFQLSAQGGTSPYSWEITAGSLPAGLSLMPSTGAIIGIPNAGTEGNYTFTVRATDSVGTTNSKSFTMYVILSSLTIRTASLSDGTIGSPYSATLSATGGVPPYTWAQSGAPSDMGFDSNGRLHSSEQYVLGISVGDYLTYHAVIYPKTYAVTFTVTDSNHTSTSKSLNLKVNIVIASPTLNTTLPYGFENQAYSTPLRAYGGIPPYSWSECYSYFAGICIDSSSRLPSGLSLNSGGAVSGTPGAATHGSYSIKFKATNGWGILYGTGTVPLTIYRVMADRTTTSLTDAAVGQSYSYPLSASGGTPPYTWVVTGLPSGLSVVSGSITGTPAAGTNGTYTLSATATDSTSHGSQTQVYSLKVYPSDIRILTTSIPSATENHSYSATISTIGGTLPFTYLSSPLPSNLSFANSVLSGTPENGTSASSPYYVSVRVADANGSYAEQIFQLNITAS